MEGVGKKSSPPQKMKEDPKKLRFLRDEEILNLLSKKQNMFPANPFHYIDPAEGLPQCGRTTNKTAASWKVARP